MNYRTILVDGDIIANKAAFASEQRWYDVHTESCATVFSFKLKKEADKFAAKIGNCRMVSHKLLQPDYIAFKMIDSLVRTIQVNLQCADTQMIVGPPSGTKIFRHRIAKTQPYKGHRNPEDRPANLPNCYNYLLDKYKAIVADDMETDDLLGIMQCDWELGPTVIATIDKDLMMIPGYIYNIDGKYITRSFDPGKLWLEKTKSNKLVLRGCGFKWFAAQMLLGDREDNIPKPVKGYGPKKVNEVLKNIHTPADMWKVLVDVYKESELDIEENADLLWILRSTRDNWRMMI